jgi:hypothetical protein
MGGCSLFGLADRQTRRTWMKKAVGALVAIVIALSSAAAFAGGVGEGGSCKSSSDCHKGSKCKYDKAYGRKVCRST